MADGELNNFLIVAAIDFGTTYSGYAFSTRDEYRNDPLKITLNKPWNAGSVQLLSMKAPTCLLLNAKKEFVAFGYEAENKYSQLVAEDDHEEYYFFYRFKMSLHYTKKLTKDLLIEDISGKSTLALDVFSLSIKALKEQILETITHQLKRIDNDDICYVLTVPAMWRDSAKQFMRKSAEMAGIAPNHLRIALEPEAASLYCQHLPVTKFKTCTQLDTLGIGVKYMVVDLGGGTADITVHEKMNDGCLKEVYRATGSDCGGTSVDVAFFNLIEKIIGKKAKDSFIQHNLEDYLDLTRDFESLKRTITPDKTGKVHMRIPVSSLNALCNEYYTSDFQSTVKASSLSSVVSVQKDKIQIDAKTFIDLFTPTIRNIQKLINDIFQHENTDGIQTIILVGGFSECPLIKDAIKKEAEERTIIVPHERDLAVLKGAVIFGHRPQAISERIAKLTYGFGKRKKFDPTIHDTKHLDNVNGEERCIHIFEKIVTRDNTVKIGQPIVSEAMSRPGKEFHCRLYQTEKYDPLYTDEEGCSLLGVITMNKSDSLEPLKIVVELIFGDTEISVKIVEKKTGKQCKGTIDML